MCYCSHASSTRPTQTQERKRINGRKDWWIERRKCCWEGKLLTARSVTLSRNERPSHSDRAAGAWAEPLNTGNRQERSSRTSFHIPLRAPITLHQERKTGREMDEWQKSALLSNATLAIVRGCSQNNLLRNATCDRCDFGSDGFIRRSFARSGTVKSIRVQVSFFSQLQAGQLEGGGSLKQTLPLKDPAKWGWNMLYYMLITISSGVIWAWTRGAFPTK